MVPLRIVLIDALSDGFVSTDPLSNVLVETLCNNLISAAGLCIGMV
jgi:hypothetical protein